MNKERPFLKGRNNIMKCWDAVSLACMKNALFGVRTGGKKCQTQWNLVVSKYNADNAEALRKSGTDEEYDELKQLLDDIVPLYMEHEQIV